MNESNCVGCRFENNGCESINETYGIGECPCSLCLVKIVCIRLCIERKEYYNRYYEKMNKGVFYYI